MRRALLALLLAGACWIEAAAQDLGSWYEVQGGAWNVPADVANAAAVLFQQAATRASRPPLRLRPISDYKVQYQGLLVDGKRRVKLSGACSTWGHSADDLRRQWLMVSDGGDCYFDAEFDPVLMRFVTFSFHGHA